MYVYMYMYVMCVYYMHVCGHCSFSLSRSKLVVYMCTIPCCLHVRDSYPVVDVVKCAEENKSCVFCSIVWLGLGVNVFL